ncbi:MAG: WapI family immunity protein [Phycisphaerae bacterium]
MNRHDRRLEIRNVFRIDILGREFPDATDFYDRNWLIVRFSAEDAVSRVGVCGSYLLRRTAFLRTAIKAPCDPKTYAQSAHHLRLKKLESELRSMFDGTRDLTAGRISQLTLPTIEPILRLSFEKRDGSEDFMASVTIHGEMCPPGGPGSSRYVHKYEFGIGRADLQAPERQLEAVLDVYPVIGQP